MEAQAGGPGDLECGKGRPGRIVDLLGGGANTTASGRCQQTEEPPARVRAIKPEKRNLRHSSGDRLTRRVREADLRLSHDAASAGHDKV